MMVSGAVKAYNAWVGSTPVLVYNWARERLSAAVQRFPSGA